MSEPVAEALQRIATHLKYLGTGNAATEMGAIECLAVKTHEGAEEIARSLDRVADGLFAIAEALQERGGK